jgi:hypothetical protein
VPENSKFSVKELPDSLQILGTRFSIPYVWLDLLCIPQDRSQRGQIELARQAAIFGGADVAVVWLNDTESWTAVQNACRWMLSHGSEHACADPTFKRVLTDWQRMLKANGDQDSNGIPEDPFDITTDTVFPRVINSSWFTSLWTLQEAILRPDLRLCNKHWEVLTIDGNFPIALDELASLMFKMDALKGPPVAQWLYQLFAQANMKVNAGGHPISILSTGSVRHCRHSRAEAVMSVLGATDWYQNALQRPREPGSPESKDPLVLGLYPLSFLKELKLKFGFAFFSSQINTGEFAKVQRNKAPIGTILPFGMKDSDFYIHRHKWISPATLLSAQEGHPSIESWELLPNGGVKIVEAGILFSSPAKNQDDVRDEYSATNDDETDLGYGEVEILTGEVWKEGNPCKLSRWMATNHTDTPKYAVLLSADTRTAFYQGIILKQISTEIQGTATVLAKVAHFWKVSDAGAAPALGSSVVDWIVY